MAYVEKTRHSQRCCSSFFPGLKTTRSNADIASSQQPSNPTPEFEDINYTLDNRTGNQDKGDLGTIAPCGTSKIKHMPAPDY